MGAVDSPRDRRTGGQTVLEEAVQMKLTYHWEGDYLIPDLSAPESPQIGIWGERRRQFLRAVKHVRFTRGCFSAAH